VPWKTITKSLYLHVWAFLQESTGISDGDFVSYVPEWRKAGAQLIGGCCRTTPATIGAISKALHEDCALGYK
jgi:S-methylmethionine-dependent homocysteine/selenocysteine methylase